MSDTLCERRQRTDGRTEAHSHVAGPGTRRSRVSVSMFLLALLPPSDAHSSCIPSIIHSSSATAIRVPSRMPPDLQLSFLHAWTSHRPCCLLRRSYTITTRTIRPPWARTDGTLHVHWRSKPWSRRRSSAHAHWRGKPWSGRCSSTHAHAGAARHRTPCSAPDLCHRNCLAFQCMRHRPAVWVIVSR